MNATNTDLVARCVGTIPEWLRTPLAEYEQVHIRTALQHFVVQTTDQRVFARKADQPIVVARAAQAVGAVIILDLILEDICSSQKGRVCRCGITKRIARDRTDNHAKQARCFVGSTCTEFFVVIWVK